MPVYKCPTCNGTGRLHQYEGSPRCDGSVNVLHCNGDGEVELDVETAVIVHAITDYETAVKAFIDDAGIGWKEADEGARAYGLVPRSERTE